MIIFGLKNYAPEDFRDKSERELSGTVEIPTRSVEERRQRALAQIREAMAGVVIEHERSLIPSVRLRAL
jgi:hypothetical protein